ncbi:MAG: hypothetical protein HQ513_18265 [Rhodospirillales bacterium]|nr:hypothetical protein [Rhodospirillales bacterium]
MRKKLTLIALGVALLAVVWTVATIEVVRGPDGLIEWQSPTLRESCLNATDNVSGQIEGWGLPFARFCLFTVPRYVAQTKELPFILVAGLVVAGLGFAAIWVILIILGAPFVLGKHLLLRLKHHRQRKR